ncbi:MAG: hypothetical protein HDR13_16605, partial [Lachnospiraceae bacterium]|nr:hypothetical protein [Lachnospiraceae bacterium]
IKLQKWLTTNFTEIHTEKLAKILLAIFIMVLSIFVLAYKVPERGFVQETLESLEESKTTVMEFSGATIAVSLAITALPDDFGSPLANTLADMNKYFIFIFAVLYVEKLIVVEGIKLSFVYIIPFACGLYILSVLSGKAIFKVFASKLMILGLAVVLVIPLSTHFTEKVCEDYLVYVDETISEANDGAKKVNEVMASGDEGTTVFEKLTEAFKTAVQGISDLLTYFENVLKRCVNSIAIMIVTTFVMPMIVLLLFRWLLKELFSLSLPAVNIVLPKEKNDKKVIGTDQEKEEEKR